MRKPIARTREPQHAVTSVKEVSWISKYEPLCIDDVRVRKPKVTEVLGFLKSGSRVCIIRGPPGSGKTTVLQLLCKDLGLKIQEYISSVQIPIEHIKDMRKSSEYDQTLRFEYHSKLTAFESFCERAWMPSLGDHVLIDAENVVSSSLGKADEALCKISMYKKIIVLEDLPIVIGNEQTMRLTQAIMTLIARSPYKVIIMMTDASTSAEKNEQYYSNGPVPTALLTSIERFDPVKIRFNPITIPSITKHLGDICDGEGITMSKSNLTALATQSHGDLRNAVMSLEIISKKLSTQNTGNKRRRKDHQYHTEGAEDVSLLLRDTSLTVFHGLGKLLYNKRLTDRSTGTSNKDTAIAEKYSCGIETDDLLEEWMKRPAMDGFDPDKVVQTSGLDGSTVAAFLHENLPFFIDDPEVFDLSQCLDYISMSDLISARSFGSTDAYYGFEHPDSMKGLTDVLASMVAARGVCFWNTHPAPRKWYPLKAPLYFKVRNATNENSIKLAQASTSGRIVHGGAPSPASEASMAMDILPYLRIISLSQSPNMILQQPSEWNRVWNGAVITQAIHLQHSGLRESSANPVARSDVSQGGDIDEDPIEND